MPSPKHYPLHYLLYAVYFSQIPCVRGCSVNNSRIIARWSKWLWQLMDSLTYTDWIPYLPSSVRVMLVVKYFTYLIAHVDANILIQQGTKCCY